MLQMHPLPLPLIGTALACLIAIALSASMLWLGCAIAILARRRTPIPSSDVRVACLTLVGMATWWPGHFLATATERSPAALQFLPAVLALALFIGARAPRRIARCSDMGRCAAVVLSTAAFAFVYGLMDRPWTTSTWTSRGPWLSGLMMTLVAGSLVLLRIKVDEASRNLRSLAGPALCAATALTVAAIQNGIGAPLSSIDGWAIATGAGIVLVGSSLARRLWLESSDSHEPPRIQRPAPSIDTLTRLPTRADFEDRLAAQVARADASKTTLALLFIDLDGFKPVNDNFGHASGDLVLKQVGERLRSLSRADDALTRIGGDEFVLMATGNPTQEAVSQVARRLIESVSRPYAIGDREVVISCSIGIVLYPESGAHTKLIARADAAMYEAKRSGGGCYCFYTPAMDEDSRNKFDLVSDLRQALERREMELFYQPKIDARSGQVTAAEALLRWKHPKRGMVPPATFIPLAERHGLITMLGNWVIEDACRQARRWRDRGLRMRVAINLSSLQMRQEDIVERIVGALQRNKVHPSLLTCEITESVAMEDTKATQETFRRLGKAGIHLSIDDFGTGYSSLSYLRRLPAEEMKIDRSFVTDLEDSADARSVVDAVIKLAHALSLRVVAEGVENPRQQQILMEMGCDEMQGYLFAKPMSARALLLWAIDDGQGPDTTTFRASLFEDTAGIVQT